MESATQTPATSDNRFVRGVDRLSGWGGALASASVILITVLVCLEIVARDVFRTSIMISDEMSGYLYAAIVFFGLAQTFRDKGFIRVESLYDRFRGRAANILRWLFVLIAILYVSVLLVDAVRNLLYLFRGNVVSDTLTQTPLYLPQSLMVIGWAMLLLQLLTYVVRGMRDVP